MFDTLLFFGWVLVMVPEDLQAVFSCTVYHLHLMWKSALHSGIVYIYNSLFVQLPSFLSICCCPSCYGCLINPPTNQHGKLRSIGSNFVTTSIGPFGHWLWSSAGATSRALAVLDSWGVGNRWVSWPKWLEKNMTNIEKYTSWMHTRCI